ncbi:MAG: hypothetical protein ACJ71P_19470 [Nitrososphaeraceae archaeon]|jgi:hypothetical protein
MKTTVLLHHEQLLKIDKKDIAGVVTVEIVTVEEEEATISRVQQQ